MRIINKNKFANSTYEITETFDAWIVLKWYEVKSVKLSKVNIKDAIIKIYWTEIFITNMDIPLYERTSVNIAKNYDQKWNRKLLLTKREITKIAERTTKTGLTIVPLEVYENKYWFVKIKFWLWKLLKKVEKKQIIKERDVAREMQREIKMIKY